MSSLDITPVNRVKTYEHIATQLESFILEGNLKEGDKLPSEGELATAFNTGRRSVRDAMQVLETKGLVKRRRGYGAYVTRNDVGFYLDSLSLSVKSLLSQKKELLLELMQVRLIIETQIGAEIAQTGGLNDFKGMEKALEVQKAAIAKADIDLYSESDVDFHRALVGASGNAILSALYNNLYGLILEEIKSTVVLPHRIESGYEEHKEILDLVKKRDAEGVRRALEKQIKKSIENLKAVKEGSLS